MPIGSSYRSPGVEVTTTVENPVSGSVLGARFPVFIGEGNEYLSRTNVEITRGSSREVDPQIVGEDQTGRAVVSVANSGAVTLGNFDGTITKFQVANTPITDGSGRARATTDPSKVTVTVNGQQVLVRSVKGTTGIVEIAARPKAGDVVRCTYFFSRTDTQATDDVSAQVTPLQANVRALKGISDAAVSGTEVMSFYEDVTDINGTVVVPANNVFVVTVDGVEKQITIPPRTDYTMAEVALVLSSSGAGTLSASTFTNNFGKSALLLVADQSLSVGDGSANANLGFQAGQADSRRRVFTVFNGPIVDGSNGGVITTDVTKVTVTVDGVKVVPESVDGATRQVTLPISPKVGASVKITYWHNTFQDTFDYLPNQNVLEATRCGVVPNGDDYASGTSFVIRGNKVYWGAAASVDASVTEEGSTAFESQIATTLVDDRSFLSVCSPVTTTSGGSTSTSQTKFLLPFTPTLGNGRGGELGAEEYSVLSNGRISLPTSNPALVKAYWGWGVQDALDRGPVTVLSISSSTITLADPVPVGADVFATIYYSNLTDAGYTFEVVVPGVAGVGTYKITDAEGNPVRGAQFSTASKGSSLTGVALEFPSGSERVSDVHFEGISGDDFTGPVDEVVTVEFAARDASPARFTTPGYGPYEFIVNESDRLRIQLDNEELVAGVVGLDLDNPTTFGGGFPAVLVSSEIDYTGGTSATVGQSYSLSSTEELNLEIDGVNVNVKVPAQNNVDISAFVSRINEAASGHQSTAAGDSLSTITLNASLRSTIDNYYQGWVVVIGNGASAATPGQERTVLSYVGSTGVATISTGATDWAGGAVIATDPYFLYNPSTLAQIKGATRFDDSVTLAANKHDKLKLEIRTGSGDTYSDTLDLGNGPFATAAALAAEIQSKVDTSITTAVAGTPDLAGLAVYVSADADGRLVFKLRPNALTDTAVLCFLDAATAAADFAILAGLDTAATFGAGQAALVQGPVAKSFELAMASSRKPYDRLILRNRIIPGHRSSGSIWPGTVVDQTSLIVRAGSGNTKAGLVSGDYGVANHTATVVTGSIGARIGFSGGLDTDAEPLVTFYDGTGVQAANNVFNFEIDGVACSVTFTASAVGTATPLGPATGLSNGSVLDQILDAMALIPGTPFGASAALVLVAGYLQQEGAGLRLVSADPSSSGYVTIGNGSANSRLGFSEGATSQSTKVDVRTVVSALMENRQTSSFFTWASDFTSENVAPNETFSTLGLATVLEDASGREYLYVQSKTAGSGSVIQFKDATVSSVVTDSALAPVTGLYVQDGDGATGEAALDGFFVTSNNPAGSGSINTSVLNDGLGQDGVVGQTYRDLVTGLTFTILPRGWGANPSGPWSSYPTGSNATFRFNVGTTFTTDANIPHRAIPGLEVKVANTYGCAVGNTASVETFASSGDEPAIGDTYYISYNYQKEDFEVKFFTQMSSVEAQYGPATAENPLSLAAYLAFVNGASIVACKQVLREEGAAQASVESYLQAIDDLSKPLPGNSTPDVVVPLRGDSTQLFTLLHRSNVIMSSPRYKSERTSLFGLSADTSPDGFRELSAQLDHPRARVIYPGLAVFSRTDTNGVTTEELVEGPFVAAAMAGSLCNPATDVATPWTNRTIKGFKRLAANNLAEPELDTLAEAGMVVLVNQGNSIVVRDAWTTVQDRTRKLEILPEVTLISDEVQRQVRSFNRRYVGVKFLPGIISQIEGRLAMLFKSLKDAGIITAYAAIKAIVDPDDPTALIVSAMYAPVFPLLYLDFKFKLTSRIS